MAGRETPATAAVRRAGIDYKVLEYEHDEASASYVVGGISPLGQRKRIRTLLDEVAFEHETIFVSAGRRGLELELAPADLAALTGATTARLTR